MREEKIYVVNFIFSLFCNFVVYLLHNITPPPKFHRSLCHVFNMNVVSRLGMFGPSLIFTTVYVTICHIYAILVAMYCNVTEFECFGL